MRGMLHVHMNMIPRIGRFRRKRSRIRSEQLLLDLPKKQRYLAPSGANPIKAYVPRFFGMLKNRDS
jgi:hypothetical protein